MELHAYRCDYCRTTVIEHEPGDGPPADWLDSTYDDHFCSDRCLGRFLATAPPGIADAVREAFAGDADAGSAAVQTYAADADWSRVSGYGGTGGSAPVL